jgi:predicted nucleic acid-binding protein
VIVPDASVLLELLLRTAAGRKLEDRLLVPDVTLHAPHLLDVEVAQVTRRYARKGELSEDRGGELLDDLARLPLERYGHRELLPRIWELRANATAYDAAYLALAETLDAQLLTRDRALASVPGCGARVEVV